MNPEDVGRLQDLDLDPRRPGEAPFRRVDAQVEAIGEWLGDLRELSLGGRGALLCVSPFYQAAVDAKAEKDGSDQGNEQAEEDKNLA